MASFCNRLDRKTFNALYYSYRQVLFKRFLLLLDSREAVEDIIQEVFMKVWLKRERIRIDGSSLRGYMFQIGHNLIVDYYRDLDRKRKVVAVQTLISEPDLQMKENKSFQDEKLAQIREVIDQLPPKRKKVFELCKFENRSYEEVSAMLGISVSTISDHIVKAKRFIRSELNEERCYK